MTLSARVEDPPSPSGLRTGKNRTLFVCTGGGNRRGGSPAPSDSNLSFIFKRLHSFLIQSNLRLAQRGSIQPSHTDIIKLIKFFPSPLANNFNIIIRNYYCTIIINRINRLFKIFRNLLQIVIIYLKKMLRI